MLLNNHDKADQLRSRYQTPLFHSVRNKEVMKFQKEAFEDLQGRNENIKKGKKKEGNKKSLDVIAQ